MYEKTKKPSPEPGNEIICSVWNIENGCILYHNQDMPTYLMGSDQIIVLRTTHHACTGGASICMVVYPGLRLKGRTEARTDALNCLPYSTCSWEQCRTSEW